MIWNTPPHTCSTYTCVSSRDGGGGTALSFTLAQSGLVCLINTSSASEREMYAQSGIVVTHVIGTASANITTPITRGMKVTDESGLAYHVKGIRSGRAFRSLSAVTYLDCEQQL